MQVTIDNRGEFITRFLTPIAKVSDSVCLTLSADLLKCVVSNNDNSVILVALYDNIKADVTESLNLNIPNINKFISLLSCLSGATIDFKVNNNHIECVTEDIKFKYFMLDDGILKVPAINIQKIRELQYDTNFIITKETISSVLKASSFTTETEKIYIQTDGTKIVGELTDHQQANVDSFSRPLSMSFSGKPLPKPLPVNFETFRMIGSTRFDSNCDMTVFVNHSNSVFVFDISCEISKLKYITSAYAE